MVEEIVKSKWVNFLVADAQINRDNVKELFSIAGGGDLKSLALVLDGFKRAYGGMWVGGKMVLTQSMVRLHANAMNRHVQDGTLDMELPLAFIVDVVVEGGFVTRIVRLDTEVGSIKFRCYGAKDVAALIKSMIPAR